MLLSPVTLPSLPDRPLAAIRAGRDQHHRSGDGRHRRPQGIKYFPGGICIVLIR
jgi:hypothetical protein